MIEEMFTNILRKALKNNFLPDHWDDCDYKYLETEIDNVDENICVELDDVIDNIIHKQ